MIIAAIVALLHIGAGPDGNLELRMAMRPSGSSASSTHAPARVASVTLASSRGGRPTGWNAAVGWPRRIGRLMSIHLHLREVWTGNGATHGNGEYGDL
jgi:hypothetical protein